MDTCLTLAIVAGAATWLLARALRRRRPGTCASGCEGCPAARACAAATTSGPGRPARNDGTR